MPHAHTFVLFTQSTTDMPRRTKCSECEMCLKPISVNWTRQPTPQLFNFKHARVNIELILCGGSDVAHIYMFLYMRNFLPNNHKKCIYMNIGYYMCVELKAAGENATTINHSEVAKHLCYCCVTTTNKQIHFISPKKDLGALQLCSCPRAEFWMFVVAFNCTARIYLFLITCKTFT